MHAGLWWGNLKEEVHLKDLGVDRRIISLRSGMEAWTDRSGSG